MNVSIYCEPKRDGWGKGPQRSECTNSSGRDVAVVATLGIGCQWCLPNMQAS
jgi:hypothetical protein